MFERFTDAARQIIVDAQLVASEVRSESIGAGEILVALLDRAAADPAFAERLAVLGVGPAELAARVRQVISGEDGLDAAALASLGIDLDAVRRRTDAVFGKGALSGARRRQPYGHIPFTAEAKRSLELALQEESRLRSGRIEVRHLMLGVLGAAGGTARTLLAQAINAEGGSLAEDPEQRIDALRRALTRPHAAA